jgi:hypothetical protein
MSRHVDRALRHAKEFKPKAKLLQDQFPPKYMPGVGRQVMEKGGVVSPAPQAPAPSTDALGMYSQGAYAAQQLPQAKGTPQQMAAMLQKQGVRPAEMEHSGFEQAFAGKPSVTREDLVQHFAQTAPKIREVVYDQHPDDEGASPDRATKYHEHQLPGGEGYREVLLQYEPDTSKREAEIRAKYSDRLEDLGRRADQSVKDYFAARRENDPSAQVFKDQEKLFRRQKADVEAELKREVSLAKQANRYSHPHWNEDNVLASLRMSDRIDRPELKDLYDVSTNIAKAIGVDHAESIGAAGPEVAVAKGAITPEEAASYSRARGFRNKFSNAPAPGLDYRLLHVEEVQSDWAQQGRQKGFVSDADKFLDRREEAKAALAALPPEQQTLNDPEFRRLYSESLATPGRGLPSAPYVTSTPGWTDLALKRILLEAAKGDYDGVVFTPGAAQSDRWDDEGLSTFYDEIVPKRLKKLFKDIGHEHEPLEHDAGEYTLPGFRVTPELRERIKRGLPHFRDGGAVDDDENAPGDGREGFKGGGSPDAGHIRSALERVASPFSNDPEMVKKALEMASTYKVPQDASFGTGSYFSIKPPMAAGDVTSTMEAIPGVTPRTPKKTSWDDFYQSAKGGTLINLGGDRSALGRLTHINGQKLAWPVDLQAGPSYMLEPNPGAVWANADTHTTSLRNKIRKAAEKGDVYGIYAPMGPQSVDFAHHMFDAVMAQIPNLKLKKKDVQDFDKSIRQGVFVSPADREKVVELMKGWPGIANAKEASEFARKVPGTYRSAILKHMDKRLWVGKGFPDIGVTRVAVTDPQVRTVGNNMLGHRIVKLDPDSDVQETALRHASYSSPTGGDYVGDVPAVQRHYAAPDVIDQMLAKPTKSGEIVHPYSLDPLGRSTARKLFEEQKQLQPINERMIDSVNQGLQRQSSYGFAKGGATTQGSVFAPRTPQAPHPALGIPGVHIRGDVHIPVFKGGMRG